MPAKSVAQATIEKADKKANSSTGWFGSASTKFEEAGDLYQQAANAFKLEKQFRQAGDAFAREAECREKCKELNEEANAWWNAAKAYKQGFPDCEYHHPLRAAVRYNDAPTVAVQALTQTISALCKAGRFRQAADREKEIAQIYLKELNDLRKACESYERAGEWYEQEDSKAYVLCLNAAGSYANQVVVWPTHATRMLRTCTPTSRITLKRSLDMSRSPIIQWAPLSRSTA